MEPLSRTAARLAHLPYDELLKIAAAGCEASTEVKNRADAILAAHKPLAQWAVEGVLLSSDLVPHLLAPLLMEDGAVAAVCSRWAETWKATSEGRRRLTKVAFVFPPNIINTSMTSMAVIPGDNPQLVVKSGNSVHTLHRDMSSSSINWGTSFMSSSFAGSIAADEQFIYAIDYVDDRLVRYTHEGIESNSWDTWSYADKRIGHLVSAPGGGLLFCNLFDDDDDSGDEIVILNTDTLLPSSRFGLGLFNSAQQMAVGGEELFVCDTGNDRLQVFSLVGEHRRSVTGEWKRPVMLCFAKDRLYLLEQRADNYMDEGELANRRIFVLSLQGETLEVYTHTVEGQYFSGLCYFDGKLLALLVKKQKLQWEFADILSFKC